ncbi:MAG: BTB/POZ domain-containing protein [Nitrososphaerales archaeon]
MAQRDLKCLQEFPPDFTVRTIGKEFHLHKSVLCTGSAYFRTLLLGNWAKEEVNLPDIPSEVFEMIVDVLYHDRFPTIETLEDYQSFSEYLGYFGITLKKRLLLQLGQASCDLLLELLDHTEFTSSLVMQLLVGLSTISSELLVELYRRRLVHEKKVRIYLKKVENPLVTLAKLYQEGLPATSLLDATTDSLESPERVKELIACLRENGLEPPGELTKYVSDMELYQTTSTRFEENRATLRELGLPLEGQALADQIRSLSEPEPSLYSRFLNLFPRGSFPK